MIMRACLFEEPLRTPAQIPVACVTLADLLGELGSPADISELIEHGAKGALLDAMLQTSDEVRRFRTPAWTWAIMGGMEGWVAMRAGKVLFWIITSMN